MVHRKIDNNKNQSHIHDKPPIGQTPLDPTDNAEGVMNDTTGATGVSKDTNNPNTPPPSPQSAASTMSDYKAKISSDPLPEDQDVSPPPAEDLTSVAPGSTPTGNKTVDDVPQPHVAGEQGVNATTPDPASDDDTLANAQHVGLRQDEDEEHPQDLDIASDIDKAEEFHRSH